MNLTTNERIGFKMPMQTKYKLIANTSPLRKDEKKSKSLFLKKKERRKGRMKMPWLSEATKDATKLAKSRGEGHMPK